MCTAVRSALEQPPCKLGRPHFAYGALHAAQRVIATAVCLQHEDAENIGYIIPPPVIQHFITDFERNGRYTAFPALGVEWQKMESPFLQKALGMTVSAFPRLKLSFCQVCCRNHLNGLEVPVWVVYADQI